MAKNDAKYQVDEYLSHFSKGLCQEIIDYANNTALLHSRYMFVSSKGNYQDCYCTHCNCEFSSRNIRVWDSSAFTETGKLKHDGYAECPLCSSMCQIKHADRGRGKIYDYSYFVSYEKSSINPNALIARGILASRHYQCSYKNVKTDFCQKFLYLFEVGKPPVMLRDDYLMGWAKTSTIYSGYKQHAYKISLHCDHKSLHKAVKGTPFEYSPYKEYLPQDDMVEFFATYSRYPVIELLWKLGFYGIVDEKLKNGYNFENAISWRSKKLSGFFRLNNWEVSELRAAAKKITINSMFVKYYQISRQDGSKLRPSEIAEICSGFDTSSFDSVKQILSYANLRKAYNYLAKQKALAKNHHYFTIRNVLWDWKDYIKDCKELGRDLTLERVYFPKNLREAHDETNQIIKRIADEKLNGKFLKRFEKLKEYCFEYNGLFIRPAMSPAELVAEGKALTHCVGSYSQDHAEGRTNIFFIRKSDEPNKSFYTVEIMEKWNSNELEINQCRSYKNHTLEENKHQDVIEFIEKFKTEKLESKPVKSRVKITA